MTNPLLVHGAEPAGTAFLYVMLPGQIEPDQREAQFGEMLDAELRLAGIGYVSGGGQFLTAPDAQGDREILYAGVDVDTIDTDAARALLREHLPDLGCPTGTCIEYAHGEIELEDRYDGSRWLLGQPRSTMAD